MTNKQQIPKTVLITGATCGIGFELSRVCAARGHHLVLVARNRSRLEETAAYLTQQYHTRVTPMGIDLAAVSAPQDIFNLLQEKNITVDILVNNAGFNEYGYFHETDLARELQMIQVNLVSLTVLTKLLLPGMLARGSGRILNVGSTGSFVPGPLNAVYCATKAYVLSFTEAMAEELRGTGVTATALCPGATRTEFQARAKMTDVKLFQGSVMDPQTVAESGYDALMRGKSVVIPGCFNKANVFSVKFMPRRAVSKMVKGLMSRTGAQK